VSPKTKMPLGDEALIDRIKAGWIGIKSLVPVFS